MLDGLRGLAIIPAQTSLLKKLSAGRERRNMVVNSSKDPLRFALGTNCLKIVYTVLPEEAGQLVYETKHWFTWS